jgi:integrase
MITDRQIRAAITAIERGRYAQMELKDPGRRGEGRFTVLVQARKSSPPSADFFAVWYRDGDRRRTKIGSYPSMALEEARALFVKDFMPKIANGQNPHGPRAWRRNVAPTINALFEAYVADLEARGKHSAQADSSLLGPNGLAEAIGRRRLASEVRPDDIVPHLAAIRERGSKVYAFGVRAWARAAFQFALKSRYRYDSASNGINWGVETNPVDAIPTVAGDRRPGERVLSPEEIRAFWRWLEWREGGGVRWRCAAALRLLISTGQRPSEILKLRSAQYDRDDSALYWETTKNGRPHSIPLPRQAVEILDRLSPNEHGIYFPRQMLVDQPANPDSCRWLVDSYLEKTGATKFTARDLRRTWKTIAGRAGLSKEIRDRLQNHAFKDVSSRHYDRYDYWVEKEEAMARWTSALDIILYHEGPITSRMLASDQPVLRLTARIVDPDSVDEDGANDDGESPDDGEEAA